MMQTAISFVRTRPQFGRLALLLGFLLMAGTAALSPSTRAAAAQQQADTATYEIFLLRSNGRPAAKAVLRVMAEESELPAMTADDLGRAKIEGLPPGESAFFLASSADGREKAFMPVLVVPEGTERTTLRLYPAGVVRGELLDEMGRPASEVTVSLSGWEWLQEPEPAGSSVTNEIGRFEIGGLIAGAYYTVNASEESSTGPEGEERELERPEGEAADAIASGCDDEWFDLHNREWRPAVETYDPNRAWAPAPEGAMWIWRAGRPDPATERYGATVEFRKLFSVGPSGRAVEWPMGRADESVHAHGEHSRVVRAYACGRERTSLHRTQYPEHEA
jgi:hypothetical protein